MSSNKKQVVRDESADKTIIADNLKPFKFTNDGKRNEVSPDQYLSVGQQKLNQALKKSTEKNKKKDK